MRKRKVKNMRQWLLWCMRTLHTNDLKIYEMPKPALQSLEAFVLEYLFIFYFNIQKHETNINCIE